MGQEVLALLDLNGSERILDVGCGDGKITSQIASRASKGSVVGVDPSRDMITFARSHFGPATLPNLRFEVADARRLPFKNEFDLVVSFNALHWVPEQQTALSSIRSSLVSGAKAQLRLVSKGARKSLENVAEETRRTSRWKAYFQDFEDPYLHLTPEEYAALAERSGFRVLHVSTKDHSWDFGSRLAFSGFCQQVDRKAMILLTDGEDQGSQYKLRDAIEAAQKADTIVYVLLCADRGFYGFGGYSGDSEMRRLTSETGGRMIEVGNKTEKLKQAFDQISQELRSQYNVGYVPTNSVKNGGFRKVLIKSKDGYKIQARSGYFAVPQKD